MKGPLIFWAACSLLGCLVAERSPLLKHAAFSSVNFENIFQWEMGAEAPPGTVYDVQYKRYGDKHWLEKSECQNITQPFCNLTRETENFTDRYYARVRAVAWNCCSSDWVPSERFDPREDTTIGKLEVKCFPKVTSIRFSIQPLYTPVRDEDGSQLTVENIYSRFGAISYHMVLFSQRTHREWERNEHNKEFEVFDLTPDTDYNGTLYLKHLEKRSKPCVFQVRTLPDNSWLLYCLGGVTCAAGLLLVAAGYVSYKYTTPRTAWPKALDLRGISAFPPLMLTVEHGISPIQDLAKPVPFIPDMQPPIVPLSKTGYQQQVFLPEVQPGGRADCFPSAYAPQRTQENPPCALKNKPLALTYGVCVESSTCISSQPDPTLQGVVSNQLKTQAAEESFCVENYKAQRPRLAARELWEGHDPDVRGSVFSLEQPLPLMLQTDYEETKRPLLQSLSLQPDGGNYRGQMAGLLPLHCSVTADTNSVSEGGTPSSSSPLLKSICTCENLPGDHSTGQLMLPDSLSLPESRWQPLDFQATDVLLAAREPACLEQNPFAPQASGPAQDSDKLFTLLFRDLELKLQWEHGQDENTLMG